MNTRPDEIDAPDPSLRCRENLAHARQAGPDPGLDLSHSYAKGFQSFQVVSSSLGSGVCVGGGERASGRERERASERERERARERET